MKTALITMLVLATCALADPLKPKGTPAPPLTLVKDGKPIYSILHRSQGIAGGAQGGGGFAILDQADHGRNAADLQRGGVAGHFHPNPRRRAG